MKKTRNIAVGLLLSISVSAALAQEKTDEKVKKVENKDIKQFWSKKTYTGNSGIGIGINYTDLRGMSLDLNYTKYLDGAMIKGIANYEYSNFLNMKHMSFGGGATYNINPFKTKVPDCIYFTVGGGLYVSHDMLDIDKVLGDAFVRNSTNLGAIVNVDNQLMISRKSSFVVSGYFNYNFMTEFAATKFWGGIGYRYNF